MALTAAEKQARRRSKMYDAGLTQLNVWVPEVAIPDLIRAAELIRQAHAEGRTLSVARLVNTATGRLSGLKGN